MARGWDSKSVESQIADSGSPQKRKRLLTPDERRREEQRTALSLSRTRILRELEACGTSGYRAALEAALAHLDGELRKVAG